MTSSSLVKAYTIPIVVLLTGAAVLIIEIIATRLLAPFFGNTIFTVSSIIGVILAALAFGYVIGGRLADRRPSAILFYRLILLAGIATLILQLLTTYALPFIAYRLSFIYGPLIVSIFLFTTPSLLLGMISPFAIKLQQQQFPQQGIGQISGTIFFWSTLGSLIGTFLAGFYLIPHFNLTNVVIAVGLILVALGLIGQIHQPVARSRPYVISLTLIIALLSLYLIKFNAPLNSQVRYSNDGVYSKITIWDHRHEGRPARSLFLDKGIQGSIYLDDFSNASPYINYHELSKLKYLNLSSALVIGGGAYLVPRELINQNPSVTVDVAEIEPELFSLSQQFFGVPSNSDRLHNHLMDGRRFLHDTPRRYEFIFSDAYGTLESIPAHLSTQEFFDLARSRLTPDGMFIGNFIGKLDDSRPSYLYSVMRTFQSVFPQTYFFAVNSSQYPSLQNIMFVGLNSQPPLLFESNSLKLALSPFLQQLSNHVITPPANLTSYPLLTDDFAPVDYLTAKAF